MAKSKRRSDPASASAREGSARLPFRPLAATLGMAAALVGAWYLAWACVGNDVLASSRYRVTLESIDITPLPEWIHSDVRAEIYRAAAADKPLSVLDDSLCQRLADFSAAHPWVAKVERVIERAAGRVQVDLQYRRPVCMADVPGGGVLPVDANGTWLPYGDFSPVEAAGYPRLVDIRSMPLGPVGTAWGDPRVSGGAAVAAALLTNWGPWKLERIQPAPQPESGGVYEYAVYTRNGTRILWGRDPRSNPPELVPAAEKVARLQQLVAEQGTLEGSAGPQEIDLRDPRGVKMGPLVRGPRS